MNGLLTCPECGHERSAEEEDAAGISCRKRFQRRYFAKWRFGIQVNFSPMIKYDFYIVGTICFFVMVFKNFGI